MEKDLRDMEWPKMEKIFVQLFLRIGEKTLRECSEEREDQKKSMAAAEKRRTEDAYQSIFLRLVVKKMVEELKYRSEVTAPDLVHSRKEYYAAIEFLLDRDNRADDEDAPRGDGEGADGRPSRHAVGRSTVGNARLLGSGDGHRPLLRGAGEVVEKMGGKGGGHTSRSDGRITIEPEEEEEAFELSAGQAAQRQVRYMQEEMQRLKKENRVMRNEKLDVESIYQQLVSEQKHEKFEQRRLNVLKAQNLQLERQLALMSRALQSRKDAVGEASATLTDLAARLQARDEEGELVPVELDPGASASMLESIRVAQGKLEAVQRTALSEPTSLQRKLYYSRGNGAETPRRRVRGTPPSQKRRANGVSGGGAATADPPRQSFVNGSHTNLSVPEAISVAVADEDDAVVRHLDLEALATLEQSLGTLAPKLIALRQGLMTVTLPHMLSPVEDRVAALARECCTEVHGTAYDLSTLRCLLPTAPPSTPSLVAQAYIPPLPTKLHQGDGLGGYGDAIGDAVGQAMAPMLSVDELVSQLPPWKREQAAAGRTALHALLEYVGAREQWLKVTLDSMGAEQSYYSTCHSVQQECVHAAVCCASLRSQLSRWSCAQVRAAIVRGSGAEAGVRPRRRCNPARHHQIL